VTRLFSADAVVTAAGRRGDAVLVDGGAVVAVGSRTDLRPTADDEYRYEGAVIIPGLRDAHIHPVGYAEALSGTTLGSVGTLAEMSSKLRSAAAVLAPGLALVAGRFDDAVVAEGRLPTRADLDAAVPDRPVLVHRYCGHIAMANSAALAVAGVDERTGDPPGGSLDRDAGGIPTGVLRETAVDLVSGTLETGPAVGERQVIAALDRLAGLGITSIGAMLGLGDGAWANLGDEVDLIARVAPDLPITVHGFVIARSDEALRDARERIEAAGGRLRWAGLKVFADGSLGGHTAAMHEPFSDAPGELGTLRLSKADLDRIAGALGLGGTVAVHAIGDRANTAVVDHYATLIDRGVEPDRLRLEHASVLSPHDAERIGRLGITASVQPAFLGSEAGWLETRLGDRVRTTYPFASLAAAGTTLAGGSDSPVESPDPFAGMALARDRAGLVPEESLSAAAALRMFTDGGAAALGEAPPLDPGSPADFVVVDRNPLESSPDELRATSVLATLVGGTVVPVDRSQPFWMD
jgi:predicted amidohydrolase YtcJ